MHQEGIPRVGSLPTVVYPRVGSLPTVVYLRVCIGWVYPGCTMVGMYLPGMLPTTPWWVYHPVYMPPYCTLGTPPYVHRWASYCADSGPCAVTRPWAQRREYARVRASQDYKVLKSVREERHLCAESLRSPRDKVNKDRIDIG